MGPFLTYSGILDISYFEGKETKGEKNMGYVEIGMIGIGLAMDAFAAAVCKGLSLRRISMGSLLVIALCFGGFQMFMPLIGHLLASQFEEYIAPVDHWVAFTLLLFIGGNMAYEAASCSAEEKIMLEERLNMREVLTLAVATSIDALAVGISFACLKVEIIPAIGMIGVITFLLSAVGVGIGHHFGAKYKEKATLAGGLILIFIGVKILWSI